MVQQPPLDLKRLTGLWGIHYNSATLLSGGLINQTWKVTANGESFILQRINDKVFKEPQNIATNIRLLADHLKTISSDYFLVSAIKTEAGEELAYELGKGYFRLTPFVKNSKTIQVVETPEQAYEAALQFGKFTNVFSGFDSSCLSTTIPDFHNLSLRYQQFNNAIQFGNRLRIQSCSKEITKIESHQHLVRQYETICANGSFKLRVTHHDTKISNVLFDQNDKGICVIDLDTVMPGYFISDVGDMMRTYLSPANEEEADFTKIEVRKEFFQAIAQGYLEKMGDDLSSNEWQSFFYSGLFIIYMQAIRFLTDYFNDDHYYSTHYQNHNLVRAQNQLDLLAKLIEQEKPLQSTIPPFNR
jgi:thiamine kinase-like enzyme